jgi:hypothetical protein
MSNSLKLTLKQLIRLGVIKLKKRRRTKQKKTVQYIPPNIRSTNDGLVGYTTALNPIRYTDELRLRDEQDRLRIKQLEQQQQQQLLQSGIRENFLNFYNTRRIASEPIIEEPEDESRDLGFAYDDNVGAFGRSADDTQFKPQAGGFALEEEEVGFGIAPEQMPVEEEVGYGSAQEIQSPRVQQRTTQRAKRKTISEYKKIYTEVAGANANPVFFEATSVSDIKPEIIKLLLAEYKSIGGTNRDVLRSKNIETIRDEITLLKSILKSP